MGNGVDILDFRAVAEKYVKEAAEKYIKSLERLGDFGKLFLDYKGCPRGAKGRACLPLEQEVLLQPPVWDVDGGEWIPVNADALRELVGKYEKLKERDENMNAKRAAKLMKIARHFGEEKQVCKLIEELGEANSAASRVLMLLTFREDGGKDLNIQDRLEHLAAELADVQNLTEQVIALFGLEIDFKVARQKGIDKTLKYIEKQEESCEN